MRKALNYVLPVAAAFCLLLASVHGQTKPADVPAGTIIGQVVEDNDKIVANATVDFRKPRRPGSSSRPSPLASAITDKDGKFELKFDAAKVADGDYIVICIVGTKGAWPTVTIKDGKAQPAELKLVLKPIPE